MARGAEETCQPKFSRVLLVERLVVLVTEGMYVLYIILEVKVSVHFARCSNV